MPIRMQRTMNKDSDEIKKQKQSNSELLLS